MIKVKANTDGKTWYYKEVEVEEDEKIMLELYDEEEEYVITLPDLDYLRMVIEMNQKEREQWLTKIY